MKDSKKLVDGKNGYLPDKLVINYVREKLLFDKEKNELKLGGKDLADNDRYANLKKRKFNVLDRIFTSMANLMFFFDCIAKYPNLEELFEDDIEDLLGVRRTNQEQIYGYILANLLYSILFVQKKQNNNADFRLLLPTVLQQIVRNKARQFLTEVFKIQTASQAVSDDFDRALAWSEMLAHSTNIENKEPSRTLNFDSEELLK
jgi:hypothetical protein